MDALSSRTTSDLETLEEGLRAVGRGEREFTIDTSEDGPIAPVASVANLMIQALEEAEGQCGLAWKDHRELMAGMAHDLRTPLASLRVLAEAAGDEPDPEELRRYAKQMMHPLVSLEMLIGDIFELSRLRAGERRWSLENVRLEELVAESVEAMAGQAARTDVALRVSPLEHLPPARANPEKLQRVLFNLITNAIHHTPRGGTITVSAEAPGDSIEVEVADDGEGVGASERDRLFDGFGGRASASGEAERGGGMGLAICRAIVEAQGGRIWLGDSEVGTKVRFSLRAAVPSAGFASAGSAGTRSAPAG